MRGSIGGEEVEAERPCEAQPAPPQTLGDGERLSAFELLKARVQAQQAGNHRVHHHCERRIFWQLMKMKLSIVDLLVPYVTRCLIGTLDGMRKRIILTLIKIFYCPKES